MNTYALDAADPPSHMCNIDHRRLQGIGGPFGEVITFEQTTGVAEIHSWVMSESVAYLRAQAEKCIRLARACTTASVSESLTDLAAEYLQRAQLVCEPEVVQQQQQNQSKDE